MIEREGVPVDNDSREGRADYTHLIRLAITVVVVVSSMLVAMRLLTPKTFGEYGHYRAASLDDIKSQEPKYITTEICAGCHHKEADLKSSGSHNPVQCETCHGPGWKHADDMQHVKPPKPVEREFCAHCHARNVTRPKGFPQVLLDTHYPGQPCVDCHNPHSPKL